MYPISSTVKALFDYPQRQVIQMTMHTTDGDITITDSDILMGSFSVDRASVTADRIELGTAIAAELTFDLNNHDGSWSNVAFAGATLFVQVGVMSANGLTPNYVPVGYFVVDESPRRNLSAIRVKALDRMVMFDIPVDSADIGETYTLKNLVLRCASKAGVLIDDDGASLDNMPNATYLVIIPSTPGLSYRNLLQYALMLMGKCAYMDYNGKLHIGWYTQADYVSTAATRYSHDLYEDDVTITGVLYEEPGEPPVTHVAGTTDYAFNLSGNPLLGENIDTVLANIYAAVQGFTYRPFNANIKPSPYLWPLDIITYTDENSVDHSCILTNVTFGANAMTSLIGAGESEVDGGYANYGTLTQVQSSIVEAASKLSSKKIDETATYLQNLNDMIANALGLYVITQTAQDGSTIYYFANASTLADASLIYTFNAGGFAWTDDWNDGSPVWNYGISADGNTVLNTVVANTIRGIRLIFGNTTTTTLSENADATGALFSGDGSLEFNSTGEFNVMNRIGRSYGSQLRLYNEYSRNNAVLNNYAPNTNRLANEIRLVGADGNSQGIYLYNFYQGSLRNLIEMSPSGIYLSAERQELGTGAINQVVFSMISATPEETSSTDGINQLDMSMKYAGTGKSAIRISAQSLSGTRSKLGIVHHDTDGTTELGSIKLNENGSTDIYAANGLNLDSDADMSITAGGTMTINNPEIRWEIGDGTTPLKLRRAGSSPTYGLSLVSTKNDTNTFYNLIAVDAQGNVVRNFATVSEVDAKQNTLVSGTNIKTVNNTSLLGSGNVAVQPTLVSGTNIKTVNNTSLLGSGNVAVQPTLTWDSVPTNGSNNPVTSDGLYDSLYGVVNGTLTFESTVTNPQGTIRRCGRLVMINMQWTAPATVTANAKIATMPEGFRPLFTMNATAVQRWGQACCPVSFNANGNITHLSTAWTASRQYSCCITFIRAV